MLRNMKWGPQTCGQIRLKIKPFDFRAVLLKPSHTHNSLEDFVKTPGPCLRKSDIIGMG